MSINPIVDVSTWSLARRGFGRFDAAPQVLVCEAVVVLLIASGAALAPIRAAQKAFQSDASPKPSRAASWLAQDDVQPIADLVNAAKPGAAPVFSDRVGNFRVRVEGRALVVTGDFPEASIWRFDMTTFDDQFDMRKLYVQFGNCAFPDKNSLWTRKHTDLLGDAQKGISYTGPWEIFKGKWLVPTARVALDGQHVYTSWFDLPSLADQAKGRLYASFALDIPKPGRHSVRISFDDFVYGTRWRPRRPGDKKPPITHGKNDLRPHQIDSIAIGVDERVRTLEKISLKRSLQGKHPRLSDSKVSSRLPTEGTLSLEDVEKMIIHVDPDRGELWEYSIDAESMASGNDMDAGRKAMQAARNYDACVSRLSREAKTEWDRAFYERFHGLYTFFVFQRNYHPTGYAQNHSSATVGGLVAGGLVWDGPEAAKWLRWGVMTCRKRIELYGRDGGLEWMNEGRHYGLRYFQTPLDLIREGTGVDITRGKPFFENEWRYAVHMSPQYPARDDAAPAIFEAQHGRREWHPNQLPPAKQTAKNTPTNRHFADVDQVFMRSDWGPNAYRARLWAGSVFGRSGSAKAKRYNWAHCRVNQGSFVLRKGPHDLILEPGRARTYRKTSANNNCIIANDVDQWGGGQVWHPRPEPDQISRVAFFADGPLLGAARVDLKNAYPSEANITAISRCLLHIKPDVFLLFDRVELSGDGKAEWRFHTAFVEPQTPSDRYTAFGYEAASTNPMKNKSKTYDEAFKKRPDVTCQIAFLTPGVRATLGMTDTYFRWSPLSRPQRHLRVVQQGRSLTLLTAFGPQLPIQTKGNAYHGRHGDISWVAIVGGGATNGLEADAHFAIAIKSSKTGASEVMRFGGGKLAFRGVNVDTAASDVFAVIRNRGIARAMETAAE